MATTLFALRIRDGDDDDLLDLLDDVLDAGVADSEWEWLQWCDARRRVFLVIRGSLAARGAFTSSKVGKSIRLSVAHENSMDNRADWFEPRSAAEGRETLDLWLQDPGIVPLEAEAIMVALPKAEPVRQPGPLVLRGRERIEQVAVPLDSHPEWSAPKVEKSSGQRGENRRGGASQAHPQARRGQETNSVIAAFGAAMKSMTDSDGKRFSLYRLEDDGEPEEDAS